MFRSLLAKEIAVALAVKLVALVLLFLLFFSPSQRPQVDAASTARHLLD